MSYTCIACRVAFADADLQRSHYRTDWHRYNLKRKVAELPPVSAETFQQKVLSQRAEQTVDPVGPRFCKVCRKKFSSDNAYSEHLKSKKHKELEARQAEKDAQKAEDATKSDDAVELNAEEEDDGMEVVEGEADEAIEVTDCLFCAHSSKSIEDNLRHMAKSHSFFVPDVEYLINPKGLLEYLGEKVGTGHACVWCSRQFTCLEAAQQHMVDRGHSIMNYDDKSAEYVDFYDYRSSYPDFDGSSPQTQGEASGDPSAVVAFASDDTEIDPDYVEHDDATGELVLPSGARAGHRSLQRYYKQSVRPSRMQVAHGQKIERLIRQYRAIGWTSSAEIVRQAEDKRRRDKDTRARLQYQDSMRLGWKANKLQNTYRRQVFLW